MSRAPSSNNPPGLDKFEKELDQAIQMAKSTNSMSAIRSIIDSMEWVCSNSLTLVAIRFSKVSKELPKFDKNIADVGKAIDAGTKVRIVSQQGRAPSVAAKAYAEIKALSTELSQYVSGNIIQMAEVNSMFESANKDMAEIQAEKIKTKSVTTDSASQTLRKAAISIFWRKSSIESAVLTMNAVLDSVEHRLLKIPEIIYKIYLAENEINGSSSILSKSVSATINAQIENDKKAQKALKDKAIFDNCMAYAKQSQLGGYISKVLNTLFSLGDMRDPPASYQIVPVDGRAGMESEIKQFYNDLYFNLLNEYKNLSDRQILYLAALSGGQSSVEEIKEARKNAWKKEIDPQDKEPVSSSNAANPLASNRTSIPRLKSDVILKDPPRSTGSDQSFARNSRLIALASVPERTTPLSDAEIKAKIDEANKQIELDRLLAEEARRRFEIEAAELRHKEELAAAAAAKSEQEKLDAIVAAQRAAEELAIANSKLAEVEAAARKKEEEQRILAERQAEEDRLRKQAEDAQKKAENDAAELVAKAEKEKAAALAALNSAESERKIAESKYNEALSKQSEDSDKLASELSAASVKLTEAQALIKEKEAKFQEQMKALEEKIAESEKRLSTPNMSEKKSEDLSTTAKVAIGVAALGLVLLAVRK